MSRVLFSSQIASEYLIGVHTDSLMPEIDLRMLEAGKWGGAAVRRLVGRRPSLEPHGGVVAQEAACSVRQWLHTDESNVQF